MDISDEELFDATPSCSTSIANTSLNLSVETTDLTLDSIQEKDLSNVATKDVSIKLVRLPKEKKETNSYSKTKKKRFSWKFGHFKRKRGLSSPSSRSQQEFQKIESVSETTSVEDREEMHTQVHNQSYEEESYGDDQENEQTVQSKTQSFILSTYQEEEEDLYANENYACSRTLPYEYHRKDGKMSHNKTTNRDKDTASSFLLSPNNKNIESNLYSSRSRLSDCSSSNNTKIDKRLIHSRLTFMAKRMRNDKIDLDERKFKKKYVSSDSENDELLLPKKRHRRISSNEFNNEDAPVSNTEAIEDNNQSESHLSLEKIDKKKTGIQINRTARVILTRLEKMKDEDVIKWGKSKTIPSDVIASELVEKQLDRRKLLQTLESQNNLILSKEDGFSGTKDIFEDPSLSSCVEKRSSTSRLNKLKKKYKLFKKPRVLMIKLETLQCSSKNGRYSTIEIDRLTKKYVTSVINSNFQYKSCGLKIYKHVHLRRKSTTDVGDTIENQNTSVSREQSTNEIFNSRVTEKSPMKGTSLFKIILLNFIFS